MEIFCADRFVRHRCQHTVQTLHKRNHSSAFSSYWLTRYSAECQLLSLQFPFLMGAVNSFWLMKINEESLPGVNQTAFILFSGAGMSFTAFPVLASILSATKLLNTPIGIQAMSCAAIDDIMAWCVLAIASSFSKNSSATDGGYTCMLAILFVLAMFYILRPALHFVHRWFLARNDELNQFFLCIVFLMLLIGAFTAEVIGIHAFFGAFIAGVIMPKDGHLIHFLFPKLELISKEFLLPLYFASSGIKTNSQ
jgi:Kef-type K+ transport system membrane component KefB